MEAEEFQNFKEFILEEIEKEDDNFRRKILTEIYSQYVSKAWKLRSKLIEVAKRGNKNNKEGIIFYEDVMKFLGFDMNNAYLRERVMPEILWFISEFERRNGKPLLSSVVMGKENKKPGKGYFEAFGLTENDWFKEIRKVWDYWETNKN